MRKTTFSLFLCFVVSLSYSQGWVDVGLKGGWGPTILMNQNILDDQDYNHIISTGGTFGAKIGYNFNSEHEITVDGMYGNFNQAFKYNVFDSITGGYPEYDSKITYSSINLLLMYRHNKDGRYFEIGPQLSLLQQYNRTDNGPEAPDFESAYFNSQLKGMTLGFGSYMVGTENFGITAGARFSYMFDDLISIAGQNENLPTLTSYSTYKSSNPIVVQLVFEANFDFAYLAKAQCGRRKLLLF